MGAKSAKALEDETRIAEARLAAPGESTRDLEANGAEAATGHGAARGDEAATGLCQYCEDNNPAETLRSCIVCDLKICWCCARGMRLWATFGSPKMRKRKRVKLGRKRMGNEEKLFLCPREACISSAALFNAHNELWQAALTDED